MTWLHHARCRGTDPNGWFEVPVHPALAALCTVCSVATECAADRWPGEVGYRAGSYGTSTTHVPRRIRKAAA